MNNSGKSEFFSEREAGGIRSHPIRLKTGEDRDVIRLTDAWSALVDKIDRDRALPYADRTVWNEFDLCAVMIIRDHLQRAIDALPEGPPRKVVTYAERAGKSFLSITVEDPGKRMAAIAEFPLEGRGWWWFRVSDSGPILQDLARWRKFDRSSDLRRCWL